MILRLLHLVSLTFFVFAYNSQSMIAQAKSGYRLGADINEDIAKEVSCAVEGTLVINEVGNYTDSKFKQYSEFIELVVVGEKPNLPVNVAGYIVDDNNSSSSSNGSTRGHIRLGDCFSEIMPGTIILLYDDQQVFPGVDIQKDGAPNAGGVYQIPFNHPCLTYVASCPFGSNTNHSCSTGGYGGKVEYWNNYINLNDNIDVAQVRNQKYQLQHALMWWPGKWSRFPDYSNARAVKVSETSVANRSISFIDENPYKLANFEIKNFFTPGYANSEKNEAYIDKLKPIVCVGETITLGCDGNEDYCYSWAPAGIVSFGKGGLGYITPIQDTLVRRTAIDADGNIVSEETYFVRTHPEFTVTVTEKQQERVNCPAQTNFEFTAEVSDEYPSYTFKWPNGSTAPTVLLPGGETYALTVTASNGCSQIVPVTAVGDPDLLASVKIESSRTSVCAGGSVQLVATMHDYLGNSGFSYQWSNGATGGVTQVSLAGEYRVTVTNGEGCFFTDKIILEESFNMAILANGTQACAENPVDLIADIYGNDDFSFTYEWSNGETGYSAQVTEGGTYALTVTNNEGCSITDVIVIDESVTVELEAEAENVIPGGYVAINPTVTQGTAPYYYNWSSGSTAPTLSVSTAGTYSLTVTDAFGCRDQAFVTIQPFDDTQCEGLEASVLFHEPNCEYYGSARLESTIVSGFEVTSYLWSTGEITKDILINEGGRDYTLIITATNGCQVEQTITVPEFESLNSLSSSGELCTLVDFLDVVSLADDQAILVMSGITENELANSVGEVPNTRLEIVAEYEGVDGPVRAIIPFATSDDVPDPAIWAGDLVNIPEETPVTVRFQVSGWNYCPVICPNSKVLNNLGAIDSVEVVLEDNPVIRLEDYECGDVFVPDDETANDDPLAVLNVGDVVTVNGFPLLVSSLAGGSNSTANSQGLYTGTGIVPLPFNDRTVQVSFGGNPEGSFINKNYVLRSGDVDAIRDQLSNYDFSMDTLAIGGDICISPVNEDGFTDEGINPTTGLDRFGFVDSTGLHSITGTEWDPNGFDIYGNHRETGEPYNEEGCNRESRNRQDTECDLVTYIDSTAQAFIDSVDTVLSGLTNSELDRQVNEADALLQIQVQKCGVFRTGITDLIDSLQFQQDFIVGDSGQYLERGMSENFASTPRAFDTYDPLRNPQVVRLEAKHVALYKCDVIELSMTDTLTAFQGADAGAVKDYLILQLSYLPADAINALKVGDAFSAWIAEKIADYLETLVPNDQGVGKASIPTSPANFQTPTQAFHNLGTFANTNESTYFGSREEMIAYELNSQFDQGFKMIQGVHRAHFLAKIAELREEDEDEESSGLLPVTVTKYIGGVQYSILLDDMIFSPVTGAKLSAYLIIEDPESGQKLVFQATNVGFGVGGTENARLELASTVAIRINNAAKLILNANQTFAEWDCQGFVGAGIGGKVEMCRKFITPLDEQTLEPLPDTVRFALNFQTYVTEWLDAVVTVDAGAFAITNNEGIKWQLDSAVVDLSDHYTPQFTPTEGYASPHYSEEGMSPLWRGFYMQNLSATLPNNFSPDSSAVTIGVEDVLMDQSGFTGEAYVEGVNLLGLGSGSAGGWPFGIDRFNVKVLHNSFAGAGFGGQIILPVFTDTMRYDARIYRHNRYKFTIKPDSLLSMDMLLAKATLLPASKIEIGYDYDGFLAVADLTGNLKFEIPSDAPINMTLPEIYFKEFRVSNRDPYFDSGTWEIRNLGVSMDFGGFGMDISKISPYRGETSTEMGLGFDLAIGLGGDDLDLSAVGSFGILGELEEVNQRQKWKFKTIDLKGLFIDANIKDVVHVTGALQWYKNNPDYGKGFQGLLQAEFTKAPLDFSTSVSAQFGKKGDTKYFFVDAMVGLGSGIPIGPLNINGFGGGVSYHMDNTFVVNDMDFAAAAPPTAMPAIGSSFSGTHYFVDPDIGIGLKASVMVATEKKELFNGWAGLEFLFNAPEDDGSGGGLAKVSFKGQGQFMADILPDPPGFLQDMADFPGDSLPISTVPNLGLSTPVPVSAWVDLSYNFNENVFDGKLEAYLNAGIIRGAGANNALVQAAMHVDSEKWYFNIGTPTHPAGILVDLPIFKAGATAYFNMGTDIPDFPGLPSNVASMAGLYNSNEGLRKSGGGVMFGARIFSEVDLNFGPVRGFLNADLGFDLMLRNYGGAICTNTGNPIGVNGWYASGQAWVYLNGGVKVLGVSVAEFGLAGIMQARLPNPLWAKATLAAEVKLLFIKKRVNFNVEIGERCELQDENGEDVPENPVINYLNPINKEQDVAVDLIPQVYFNYPIGSTFTDGNGDEYSTRVSEVSMRTLGGNYPLYFDKVWTNDNTVLSIAPRDFFPGGDSIQITISVEVKKGSTVERTESREIVFHTAPDFDFIPVSNVEHSYPINGMYDFYPEEYNRKDSIGRRQGFVQLDRSQANLLMDLSADEKNEVLLESSTGDRHLVDMAYDITKRLITFPMIPENLTAATVYRLTLVRTEKGMIVRELLLPIHFRVSEFSRFALKIQAINNSPPVSGSRDFSRTLNPDAYLGDAARIGIGELAPLVRMQASTSSSYLSTLNATVNDAFPKDTPGCGVLTYADESNFRYLREAAGISSTGSDQVLVVGAGQFTGLPFASDFSQTVSYLAVKETQHRFEVVKDQIALCAARHGVSIDLEEEDGDNATLSNFLNNYLGHENLSFYYTSLPSPPSTDFEINVSYVLPNNVPTSSGMTIKVPK